jgi:hypothetical protein
LKLLTISQFITILLLVGCTSIEVQKLDPTTKISHLCIEDNPKVIVRNFLSVVKKGFKRHGITTEVYEHSKPNYCEFHLTYTALKKWDLGTYMTHAELWLYSGKNNIAFAEYHLKGGGGLALNKWASVESKMDPVINQLLSGFSPELVNAYRKPIPKNITEPSGDTENQLIKLKKWLDDELITEEEYKAEKQKVLKYKHNSKNSL